MELMGERDTALWVDGEGSHGLVIGEIGRLSRC
jgi:hypothetical protein